MREMTLFPRIKHTLNTPDTADDIAKNLDATCTYSHLTENKMVPGR